MCGNLCVRKTINYLEVSVDVMNDETFCELRLPFSFFFGGFVSHIDKKHREKITQFVLFGSRSIINVKACAELLRLVRNIKIRHRRHSAHESNFLTAQMESATSRISRRSRPHLGMEDS